MRPSFPAYISAFFGSGPAKRSEKETAVLGTKGKGIVSTSMNLTKAAEHTGNFRKYVNISLEICISLRIIHSAANTVGFGTFLGFYELLVQFGAKISSRWGGYVYTF